MTQVRTMAQLFPALLASAALVASAAGPPVERLDGSRITPDEIDQTVTRLMRAGSVTGVAIAVLEKRKAAYLRAYGERDTSKHLPLTPDSVMTAASYSKSMFACAVMQLVEENALDLDKPVQAYLRKPLPEYERYSDLAGDVRYHKITSRMLLSHTAGFPNLRVFNDGKLNINFEPGSRYAYSGEGIELLQLVVEEITRKPLHQFMRERVFEPFGMRRTSTVWESAFESDFANGYDEGGRSLGPKRRTQADAAGSFQTTLADFSRFVEAIAQGRHLSQHARSMMLSPQIAIRSRRQFPTLSTDTTDRNEAIRLSYGLGWGLFWSPAGKAFFKEGHDEGFQHYTVMFDDRGVGLVIMTNSSNGEGIFQELLERVIGNTYTPIEWEGYVPYGQRPPPPPVREHRAVTVDAKVLDSYVGRYKAQGQPVWTVARDGNRLTILEEGDTELIALTPESEDTFYAEATDAELTFEREPGDRSTGLVARVKGLVIRARRVD